MTAPKPHFGFTRHGLAVHQRTVDHLSAGNPYTRFNKRVALALTAGVGTMHAFWLFSALALCSLPSVLSLFGPFTHTFPSWMVKASIIALVAWIAQTFFQLVLLPALMVGQNLQTAAADARAAKQFEDTEKLVTLQQEAAAALTAVSAALASLEDKLNPVTPGGIAGMATDAKAARQSADEAFAAVRTLTAPAPPATPTAAGGGAAGERAARRTPAKRAASVTVPGAEAARSSPDDGPA